MSINIIQHKFSISNVRNTKYKILRSGCPRLRLPGYVIEAGRSVHRSPKINGGDNRSIDVSKLDKAAWLPVLISALKTGCAASSTPLPSRAGVLVSCMEHTGLEA